MRSRTIKCNVKKTISYRQIRNLYKTVEIIPYVPFRRFTDILNTMAAKRIRTLYLLIHLFSIKERRTVWEIIQNNYA